MRTRHSPVGALARGLAAGAVGTAAMTAYRELVSRARGGGFADAPDRWEDAAAPAQVGHRLVHALFRRDLPTSAIPLVTNVVHWTYGTAWGGAFGLLHASLRRSSAATGLAFGAGVWAMSYVELVPMGLYRPPWEYGAKTLATDLSYHLVYGAATAAGYEALS